MITIGNIHFVIPAHQLPTYVARVNLGLRYRVTDIQTFAQEVSVVMMDQTVIDKIMSVVIAEAIDQGAFGIEEHEDQDG